MRNWNDSDFFIGVKPELTVYLRVLIYFFQMVTDQDNGQNTSLHLAVEHKSFEVAKLCIDKGMQAVVSPILVTFKTELIFLQ